MERGKQNRSKQHTMKQETPTQILIGHISPETAYQVEGYPCGFRRTCLIRYWLETDFKRGCRLVSQTTNPNVEGGVWHKPKASTYCRFGVCMYLNDERHVTWSGAHEYMSLDELIQWEKTFGAGVPEEQKAALGRWIAAKTRYEDVRRSVLPKPDQIVHEETFDLDESGDLVRSEVELPILR
jgi:hypothetical protein